MKKFIVLLISLIMMAGCATIQDIPGSVTVTGIDFTKYTQKGFLFTPERYSGEYESIGMLNATIYPELIRKSHKDLGQDLSKYNEILSASGKFLVEKINSEQVIDELYNTAYKMGADAIINFHIESVPRQNGDITTVGIEVSGYAIKRKSVVGMK